MASSQLRTGVASVARALSLLDALADSDRPLGVSELARRIGVNASTASRLLATLEQTGYVERTSSGPYRLGLKLVRLSEHVLAGIDLRERARPWLQWLVDETGETATLSVPGPAEAVTVDFVPSPRSVASMARLGRPSVPHATAAGKVMLAFAEAHPAAPLTAYTEHTITDARVLEAQLDRVRKTGLAEAAAEREPDLAALAVPVLGREGQLVAILGLQGPTSRVPGPRKDALADPLRRAAAEVGAALGVAAGGEAAS
jgi:IclR family acetate operon transcriptional repressor